MEINNSQITQVSIDLIDDPRQAMRSELDLEQLKELSDDIKRNGLIEPVIVRPHGDRYEVVAGHRRTAACKVAGLVKISCIIRELNDEQALAVKVSENFIRADIDPVDEALFYAELVTESKVPVEKIAELIGRRIDYVQGRLDLLQYPAEIITAIKNKDIKLGVAHWLAQITDEKDRTVFLEYAIKDGVTEYNAKNWYNQWYYTKQANPNQTVADYTSQEIRDFGRPRIPCAKCTIASDIRELTQVYVHRNGCEEYIEALQYQVNEEQEPTAAAVENPDTPLPLSIPHK